MRELHLPEKRRGARKPLRNPARILLLAFLVGPVTLAGIASPAHATAPTAAVSITGPGEVIAGNSATYTISATNTGGIDGFNLALVLDVPEGIAFDSSTLGTPVIYDSSDPLVPPLATGLLRWVWEDVSDLPASGTYQGTVTVTPTQPSPKGTGETAVTTVFPVGSTYDLDAYAYLGGTSSLLPVFGGSTGVGGATAIAETGSAGPSSKTTTMIALDMTKVEPHPESELPRGVHDQTTVYTLEIENTTEGDTDNVILVDYIPAGLEFLGCGAVDNSTIDWDTGDSVAVSEYFDAPDLTGTPVIATDCPTPTSVDTVVASAADATTYGVTEGLVYTRVEWDLGTLAMGTTTYVKYAAAVPLYENTIAWTPAATPTAASLGQTANLDNNTGASTRHGDPATPIDGDVWTNVANVGGDYAGIVRTAAPRATTDRATEIIYAMDLAVLKAITAGATFDTDEQTTFELTLQASEYMDSSSIVLTDSMSNGLCPLVPTGTPLTNASGLTVTDCTSINGVVTGAHVDSVTVYADGTWDMVLRPTSATYPVPGTLTLPANDTHTITYKALNRGDYELATEYGPTTSGDSFGNTVEFTAVTDAVTDLQAWFPPTWNVWDDSGESMPTDFTTINKRVMDRTDVIQDLGAGTDPCTSGTATWNEDVAADFRMGDTVCFELSVVFPSSVDVRNPIITDFLPSGLTYEGYAVIAGSVGPTIPTTLDPSGGRLEWTVGTVGAGGDLYVSRGSTFTAHMWATVVAPSNGILLDKPENLMKYRQHNVDGELFFLREEAAVLIDPELRLIKGVQSVLDNAASSSSTRAAGSQDAPDGTTFASNRDDIEVVEGEVVTYRVDVYAQPYPADNAVIWDELPSEITKADVSSISDGGVAYDSGDGGYPAGLSGGNSVIVWTGVAVPYDGGAGESRKTLTYDVTIPTPMLVRTNIDNTASIISYTADINASSVPNSQTYYPSDSLDGDLSASWNTVGTGTIDDSRVRLPRITVSKVRTSPTDTNNTTTQLVPGELGTFDISVTIPAYTTVGNGLLYDQVRNSANSSWITPDTSTDWVVDATATQVTYPGGTTAEGATGFTYNTQAFTIDTAAGRLTFPASYTNTTATAQVFTVHVKAYIDPDSAWTHGDSSSPRDRTRFTSDTDSRSSTRSMTAIEPQPQIAKLVSDDSVTAGQTVTYTLTANNTTGRPTSYDTQVIDCVPVELTSVALDVAGPSQGSASIIADAGCTGTRIVWEAGAIVAGSPQTLTYTATASPASAGGATYVNSVGLTGYSLDDAAADRATYTDSTTESITVLGAGLTKGVDSPTATIGEERDFTISVTLPADVNFYDTAMIDTVPATMSVDTGSVVFTCTYGGGGSCAGDLPGAAAALTPAGTTIGWWLGDITSNADTRTIVATYTATVLDQVATDVGDTIVNTAALRWNTASVIVGPPADASYVGNVGTTPATATVTIVEPTLAIAKLVNSLDSDTVAPGEAFSYGVTVTNTGTSTAYTVTVEDVIPTNVIVNEASISDGGVLTGESATTGGGTITWTLASLAVGAGSAHTFTYDATLAASSYLDASSLTNVADVEQFFSHPTGTGFSTPERREYSGPAADAVVAPDFPDPVITKTPTGSIAYIGEAHIFTIVVTNDGDSEAEDVTVVDTLFVDWSYNAGSTTVGGAPAADPGIASQVLTWSALPDLLPSESVTIVYTATPDAGATWNGSNTGSAFDHTNVAVVTVDDLTGAPGNSLGNYTASTDADVQIHSADIAIDKAHTGSPTAGAAFSWTLTVTNAAGGDPAVGPVAITDTLPAGATFVSVAGTGWSGSETAPGIVTLTHAGPIAAGGALPIATINVTLPASLAASSDFTNSAVVSARTFDPNPPNNDDDDPASTVIVADVELTKDSVGGPFVAGESMSWEIDVTNNGPSIAAPTFTVTDTLPSELDWDTVVATGTDWACDPVTAGGVLVCRWSEAALAVTSSTPTLTVAATILTSATGTIDNTATVAHPTPDTDPDNNTDDDSDPINTDADLALVKSTVTSDIPANGTGRYRIELVNNGPSDALNVVVDDTLPAGLTYAGALTFPAGDGWTCVVDGGDASMIDCTLTSNAGTMVDGSSTWFEFDVTADASVVGLVLNTATVSSDTPDSDASNDTDDSTTEPELIVNKSADRLVVERGGVLVYRINVESTSYGSTDDVTLIDVIPSVLKVTDVTIELSGDATVPDWDTCDLVVTDPDGYGGVLTCILDGALARGRTTPDIVVSTEVNPLTTPGSILNAASVEWTDPLAAVLTVYTDVDDVSVTITLTAAELAASGPPKLWAEVVWALTLLMAGLGSTWGARRLRRTVA